jgi:hypothetical protein
MPSPIFSQLRLNEIRQKSSHNTYDCDESFVDQVFYRRLHSLEIDIWRKNSDGNYPPDNGWWVYHAHSDNKNPSPKFSMLLNVFGGIHNQFRNHEVITVFLELKNGFDSAGSHWVTDLDKCIGESFITHCGLLQDVIFKPADLADPDHPAFTLRESIAHNGWPTLGSLKNKFMFILTGPNNDILPYDITARLKTDPPKYAFLMPEFFTGDSVNKYSNAVFLNYAARLIPEVSKQSPTVNLICRAYGADSNDDWNDAVSHNIHHIATEKIAAPARAQDGVFFTNNEKGWPFQLMNGVTNAAANESFDCYGLKVSGGSIGGNSDSCFYAYVDCSAQPDRNYHYLLSARKAHESAIGTLMFRESPNDSGSRCLIVSWTNKKSVGVFIRKNANGDIEEIGRKTYTEDELRKVTTAFLNIKIDGGGSRIIVASSVDLVKWEKVYSGGIDPACCKYQGIALSSGVANEQAYYTFGGEADPFVSFDNTVILGQLGKPDPIYLKNISPPFDNA